MRGRVLRVSGIQALVEAGTDQLVCELRGRLKWTSGGGSSVVAGDWVDLEKTADGKAVIGTVLERNTHLARASSGSRPQRQVLIANADQCVIVVAPCEPALRQGFIDRAVVMAVQGGAEPVLCVNKIDLDPQRDWKPVASVYADLDYPVFEVSAKSGEGIHNLFAQLRHKTSAFVGQSGVGKSTILNRLDPVLQLRTAALMRKHDRGRHTTSAVSLMQLGDTAYVADTPGVKQLQPWGIDRQSLADYFVEMEPLAKACRFRDCTHLSEPGCAIREAVTAGAIHSSRYEGFRRLGEGL